MSTTLALKQCPFCYDAEIPLSRVLFLQCGHNVCMECITKCNSKCPECRRRIVAGTPHRIYLAAEQLVQCEEIPTVEVPRGQETRPATSVETVDGKPLRQSYEEACRTNEQLNKETQALKQQLRRLKRELEVKSIETDEKDITIERYKASYQRKKQEKQELQAANEAGERKIKLLNTKLKALTREKVSKRRRRSSGNGGDASLLIEDKVEIEQPTQHQAQSEREVAVDLDNEQPIRHVKRRRDLL